MTLLNRTAPDLRVRMTIVYAVAGWLVALTSLNSPAVAGTTAKCPYVVKKEDIGSPEKTREYVFHLSGAFPQVYLAALYNRLAQCAPDALKPQRYDIERSQIFTTAFDNNILPGGERSILPKDFEDATLALSRYVIRRAPDLESSPSMFFLPGVKPVVEDHYFKQILTDAKGINDPSRVSQRTRPKQSS